MCDIQLFNGFGILISGFISMKCGLQAYHWQNLVYLAWFSSVTHLSGLTVLKQYLHQHPSQAYIRYGLMMTLLIILITAIIPTGFFNWLEVSFNLEASESSMCPFEWVTFRNLSLIVTGANESSPAICYFGIRSGREMFHTAAQRQRSLCTKSLILEPNDISIIETQSLPDTAAFQAMVFSIVLLACGFVSRSLRLFKSSSIAVHQKLRQPIRSFSQTCLLKIAGDTSQMPTSRGRRRHVLAVNPFLALVLAFELIFDSLSSMLAEASSQRLVHGSPVTEHEAS